uniref:GST C-terminal domain-containing protein n=1 Tax=Nymphaea colorata TaxID=210225 RepID=A0A5K1EKA1_9MAGN
MATIQHIVLGSLLGWLRVLERLAEVKLLHPSKTPKLVAWAQSFCKDEAVKEVMPETDKLAEFAKVIHARMRAASAASH